MGLGCQNHTPAALPPSRQRDPYIFYKRLIGHQGPFGGFRAIESTSEFDPRATQTVASPYDFYSVPAHEYKEYHNNNDDDDDDGNNNNNNNNDLKT